MLQRPLCVLSLSGLLSCLAMLGCDTPPDPVPSADVIDESVDPTLDALLASNSCGKTDPPCCGRRAPTLKGLAKRCSSKNTVCPQSESSDICTPCRNLDQPCCIVDGKPHCRDGSKCAHSVAGGKNQEAGSGICISP